MRNARRSRLHPVRRVTRWVVNSFMVVAILACLAWLAPSLLGYERYVITGGSMSGTFEKGSVVFERAVPVDRLAVGDVITYLPPADAGTSDLVTHRIVEQLPGEDGQVLYRTQGDANPDPDPWLFSLVEGTQPVVEFSVPRVGYAFVALADPQVRMLVIGVPAGLIALMALVDLVAAVRAPASAERSRRQAEVTVPAPRAPSGQPVGVGA